MIIFLSVQEDYVGFCYVGSSVVWTLSSKTAAKIVLIFKKRRMELKVFSLFRMMCLKGR